MLKVEPAHPPSEQITPEATPACTIQDLPVEIREHIFCELDAPDALRASLVCRDWNAIISDDPLWKFFLGRDFKPRADAPPTENYREAYKKRHILRSNLANGVFRRRLLSYRLDSIRSLIYANGKVMASPYDQNIYIWNAKTGTLLQRLEGHSQAVTSLAYTEEKLISTSYDNIIKVWDLSTNRCLHDLKGNAGAASSIALGDKMLFTGCYSGMIKIWDLSTNTWLYDIVQHKGVINSLVYIDGMLISGSADGTIKVLDFNHNPESTIDPTIENSPEKDTLQFNLAKGVYTQHALEGHSLDHLGGIKTLLYADGKLFSGSCDMTIKIWEMSTRDCLSTLAEHQDDVRTLVFAEGFLISCSGDNTIKVWDTVTGNCLHTMGAKKVMTIAYGDGMLILGFSNGQIEIWDFNYNPSVAQIANNTPNKQLH